MQREVLRRDMLTDVKVLLIDTCGEVGLVALSDGGVLVAEESLPAREASRALMDTIAAMLAAKGWSLGGLDAVAVVAGPGSFTGVRVGMSAAKGLVEASGLRLISVSRLAMLARASKDDAVAVFDAGRGEFYTRTSDGVESLVSKDVLVGMIAGKSVLVAEPKAATALAEFAPQMVAITLRLAMPLVEEALKESSRDAALADANYVRREQDIYARRPA